MSRTSFEPESLSRPEAMADVPGVGEVTLTRAVVQYRDRHEVELDGGRIEDMGLGLVLEGRSPASAEAVDLGSGAVKVLDLSAELVVLDWVYPPTLDHVARLLEEHVQEASAGRDRREAADRLESYCFELARQVLGRIGFGSLTRPTVLRIGFRDICRDLDLHEGTSIRLALPGGSRVRIRLDYDACALVVATSSREPDVDLERAIAEVFARGDVRRLERERASSSLSYQVRFPLPLSLDEARRLIQEMRRGLDALLARFEPRRFRAAHDVLDALGSRSTLDRLRLREPRVRSVPLASVEEATAAGVADSRTIH